MLSIAALPYLISTDGDPHYRLFAGEKPKIRREYDGESIIAKPKRRDLKTGNRDHPMPILAAAAFQAAQSCSPSGYAEGRGAPTVGAFERIHRRPGE